jgi:2-haloacid dehalogenase
MPYRLVTFDVYSALCDVEGSLVPELRRVLGPLDDPTLTTVCRTWRATQLECAQLSNSLAQGHRSFRDLTSLSLDYTLRRFGLAADAAQRVTLVDAWDRLRLWPEAPAVLAAVAARGYPLAVLSNGDEPMLRALLAHASVAVQHVFAADQAGHYKPHPRLYALPLERLGLAPADVLHVAGSRTDVLGARAAGLACAWSNRQRDLALDPAYLPTHDLPDLTGLLAIL